MEEEIKYPKTIEKFKEIIMSNVRTHLAEHGKLNPMLLLVDSDFSVHYILEPEDTVKALEVYKFHPKKVRDYVHKVSEKIEEKHGTQVTHFLLVMQCKIMSSKDQSALKNALKNINEKMSDEVDINVAKLQDGDTFDKIDERMRKAINDEKVELQDSIVMVLESKDKYETYSFNFFSNADQTSAVVSETPEELIVLDCDSDDYKELVEHSRLQYAGFIK